MSSTYHPTRLNVDPSAFIAPGAVLVGEVTIGRESSVWFQTTLRGDLETIEIGEETNIQDGCTVHVDVGYPARIGARVTLGHGAIVHGATVEDEVLVAMRAVILNGCRVGRRSLIGAGAVLPEGFEVPEGSLVLGVPARIVRGVKPRELERIRDNARSYVALSRAYREGRIRIEEKGR